MIIFGYDIRFGDSDVSCGKSLRRLETGCALKEARGKQLISEFGVGIVVESIFGTFPESNNISLGKKVVSANLIQHCRAHVPGLLTILFM